jgi:hypothetical protein
MNLIEPTNVTWHILSPNLVLLYGSYMRGVGLKWRPLPFWYTLFRFDPIVIINIVPKFKGVNP